MGIGYDLMVSTEFAKATMEDGYNGKMTKVSLCFNDSKVYVLSKNGYHFSGITANDLQSAIDQVSKNSYYIDLTLN